MTNPDRKGDALFIDPEKVKILNELKDIPGIIIVISSSWREAADNPLTRLGLDIPISGHTDHYHEEWLCRGNEIENIYKTNIIEPAQSLVRAGGQIKTYITML